MNFVRISLVLEARTYAHRQKKKKIFKGFSISNIFTVDRTQLYVKEDHLTQLSLEFSDIFCASFTSFDYVLHVSRVTEMLSRSSYVSG